MDAYLGTIMMCAWNFTPTQYAACNGAILAITQNQALFALLGTTFGGNGTTNFGLPNLEGRTPVNRGQAPGGALREFGVPFGQDSAPLALNQIPPHQHTIAEVQAGRTVTMGTPAVTINASDAQGDALKPTGNYWAKTFAGGAVVPSYHNAHNVTMASDAVQVAVSATFSAANLVTNVVGAAVPVSLAQPSLALNFVICTAGLFPSRT